MKLCLSFLFALVALSRAEITEEEGVIVATNDNWADVLAAHKNILVEFYAPWCGHCKALAPEYASAAQKLAEEGSELKLAKVDATVESDLASKFEVKGYPTLKFFVDGEPMEYGGGRKADEIINWLKKKTGPPAESLTSTDAADKFKDADDVVVVGFFKDASSANAQAFEGAARKFDGVSFGIVSDEAVATHLGFEAEGMTVFQKFDAGKAVFDGDFETEALVKFIKANQLPLVSEFTQESASKIFGGEVTKHIILFISKEAEDFATKLEAMKTAAVDNAGKVLFIYINIDEADNERILEFFGLKKEDCPTVRLISLDDNMQKYTMDTAEINADTLKAFASDYLAGKLAPHLMSAEEPEDWDAEPVKVLVGKTFRQRVEESGKSVFVEFYAPWCGHCKALTPIWDELAEKYKDSPDIMIAKVDSTANEIEGVKVSSFPTLKYFKAGQEEPIPYSGDRKLDAFVKFIEAGGVESPAAGDDDDEADDEEAGHGGEL